MLIGIPSILGPELLATLRGMGHGDEIAVVDGNYPAAEHARRLIRADGLHLIPVADAILRVCPVDESVPEALFRATVTNNPLLLDPVHEEMERLCAKRAPKAKLIPLLPAKFYERVRGCHAVVATGEPRLYANMIIRKGVILPEKGEG